MYHSDKYAGTGSICKFTEIYLTDLFLAVISDYFEPDTYRKIPVYEVKSSIREVKSEEISGIHEKKLSNLIQKHSFPGPQKEQTKSIGFWKNVLVYLTKLLKCKELCELDIYEEWLLSVILKENTMEEYNHPLKSVLLEEIFLHIKEEQIRKDEESGIFNLHTSKQKAEKIFLRYKNILEKPSLMVNKEGVLIV